MLPKIAIMMTLTVGTVLVASTADARPYYYHHYRHYVYRGPAAPYAYAPARRAIARDRVANPGRGNPDRTPQNATTEPF